MSARVLTAAVGTSLAACGLAQAQSWQASCFCIPDRHGSSSTAVVFSTTFSALFTPGDHVIVGGQVGAFANAYGFSSCSCNHWGVLCPVDEDDVAACLDADADADVLPFGAVSVEASSCLPGYGQAWASGGAFGATATLAFGQNTSWPCDTSNPHACYFTKDELLSTGGGGDVLWLVELESTGATPATMAFSVTAYGGGGTSIDNCGDGMPDIDPETSVTFLSIEVGATRNSVRGVQIARGSYAVRGDGTTVRLGIYTDSGFVESVSGGIVSVSGSASVPCTLDLEDLEGMDANVDSYSFTLDGNLNADAWPDSTPAITWSDRVLLVAALGSTLNSVNYNARADFDVDGDVDADDMQVFNGICGSIDVNQDRSLDNDDFFDFLTLYSNQDLSSDVNGDGSITNDDVFDFLSLFSAGGACYI